MNFKQSTEKDVKVFLVRNDLVLQTEPFEFDFKVLENDQRLLHYFPEIIELNEVKEVRGFNVYGGIFSYDKPECTFALLLYKNANNMKIELYTAEVDQVLGQGILKAVRRVFKHNG